MSIRDFFDVTAANRRLAMEMMCELTARRKYVQPAIFSDTVWLSYQHYLGEHEPTPDLIEHMIHILDLSLKELRKMAENENNDYDK